MTTLTIPYREQFNRQTERLIAAYVEHTGVPKSWILVPAGGNSAYLTQIKKHSVSAGKHDVFLENLSALWPVNLEWPEDIPRPPSEKADFDQLPKEARETLAARIAAHQRKSAERQEKANG